MARPGPDVRLLEERELGDAIAAARRFLRALAAGDGSAVTRLVPREQAERLRPGPALAAAVLGELGISAATADVIAGGLPGSISEAEYRGYYFRFRFDQPAGPAFILQAQFDDAWRVAHVEWMQPVSRRARIRPGRRHSIGVQLPSERDR
jgi:hypothetical protein